MKQMWVFCNGILRAATTSMENWNDRAALWVEQNTNRTASVFSYPSSVSSGCWFQAQRVKKFAGYVNSMSSFQVHLVGHSNGCRVILDSLRHLKFPVASVHLVASAANSDCHKNGVNEAVMKDRVEKLYFYCSHNDRTLEQARTGDRAWWAAPLRWLCVEYGYMGLTGPANILAKAEAETIWCDDMDHSTWWSRKDFDNTMALILNAR